jgi:DNA adenine methylase
MHNEKNLKNVSPLRYPGGKTRACKPLDIILNDHFDIKSFNKLISPFFGGGSFEFYIQNNYGLEIIANDKFKPLYNFWNTCKNDNDELCTNLYKNIDNVDKDTFTDLREKIMTEEDNLQQSVMYFIINRCSFSGATLSGGFSLESSKKRFTNSSIDRINQLNLTGFTIYNCDFEEFINKSTNKNNDENSLLFLDPPYYLEKKSKLYGNNGDLHENFNHDKLFKIMNQLKEKNINWIITYNNCTHIRNLYKDYLILDVNWSYGMNKSKESSEIVIINSHHK